MSKKKRYSLLEESIHFSIDDILNSLLWIERNDKKSIFEAKIFNFARWLYESYGVQTTYNCFFENERGSLKEISDKYCNEIKDAEFLWFAFHCKNPYSDYNLVSYEEARQDYIKVVTELKRIAGEESISSIIRTHFFHGNKEAIRAFVDCGVTCFLTADDDRGSYDLVQADENEARKKIFSSKRTKYLATDIRLELFSREEIQSYKKTTGKPMVIFTHEWYAAKDEAKEKMKILLESYRRTENEAVNNNSSI